jgi:hypothetical protein
MCNALDGLPAFDGFGAWLPIIIRTARNFLSRFN